ncbi:FAD-dependent oxidoreductase [Candidatus Nomurabacteria bacterium]|nr:FAD-dependent oxidoreductase [Candidatus Nomurabacteria bacterium]
MSFIKRLKFVKKQLENDDIYTFYFRRPKNLIHKAGQHGLFLIAGLYRPHPFTISSSPDEEFITISTHTSTGSRYKKKLMSMRDGDAVFLVGPVLGFTFSGTRNSYVFLTQGIGITPFRSMLASAHSKSLPIKTTLIHVDGGEHSFRELTRRYATKAFYPTNSDEFRELVSQESPGQLFYISGSPRFVRATRGLLRQRGVEQDNVKTDSFFGY